MGKQGEGGPHAAASLVKEMSEGGGRMYPKTSEGCLLKMASKILHIFGVGGRKYLNVTNQRDTPPLGVEVLMTPGQQTVTRQLSVGEGVLVKRSESKRKKNNKENPEKKKNLNRKKNIFFWPVPSALKRTGPRATKERSNAQTTEKQEEQKKETTIIRRETMNYV